MDEEARGREQIRADIAASFQQSAVKHLEERARRAVEWANDSLAASASAAASASDDDSSSSEDPSSSSSSSSSSPHPSHPPLSCMVVAGGVAANQTVRARLAAVAEEAGLPLVLPPPKWCTDNGVMVAWAGVERLALGLAETPPTAAQARQEERHLQLSLLFFVPELYCVINDTRALLLFLSRNATAFKTSR